MNLYVGGYGNASARLVGVGEAPGKHECESGIPFSGPAGQILNSALSAAGIDRSEIYLTNVVKIRPPNNEIDKLYQLGKKIEDFLPQLWDEILAINPNCILAIGGTALEVLTGYRGIEKYRGSILQCSRTGHKVIASLHPAVLLHDGPKEAKSWKDIVYINADVKRAVEQSAFPEIKLPERSLSIARNSLDVVRFLDRHQTPEVSIDVESYKSIPLCVGMAFDRNEALSIPLFPEGENSIPMHDLCYIWELLAEFHADVKTKIIAQNGKFDEKRCRSVGLNWKSFYFDTELGWHTLYPELGRKLQIISSLITEEPFYKDEGKEYNPKKDKFDRLLLYNAKDAVVEFECYEKILSELTEYNLLPFFYDFVMPLHDLYGRIEDIGILIDQAARKNLKDKYEALRTTKHDELIQALIGTDNLDENSSFMTLKRGPVRLKDFNVDSPKQVAALLYGYLKCPVRKDTGDETLKALMNNAIKDQRRKTIIKSILEERKIGKSIGTYIDARPSNDGRMRTQYRIDGTETGRTSTAALKPPVTPTAEGVAFQTISKHEDPNLSAGGADIRSMYIADKGYVFIEADQAGAEDRVVAVLARDEEAFLEHNRTSFVRNSHGMKDDRHTKTAMSICGLAFEEITDYYRQIGKHIRHAGNYKMGKHRGMELLAGFGIFLSEWKVGQMLEKFHADNERVRSIFHQDVENALKDNDCTLVSPHGRRRIFFERWGEDLFKEAYAFIPQATVSDQTKLAMRGCRYRLPKIEFEIVQESHDSFLSLCKLDLVKEAKIIIKEEIERAIDFRKCTLSREVDLVIPAELKVGDRWSEMEAA